MLGLGFIALRSGLRFTIYAVPIMGLGFGFFVWEFAKFVSKNYKEEVRPFIPPIAALIALIFALYPAVQHIQNYKVTPVFDAKEVELLDDLKGIADREDYVLTWWDYGYPIRYYSDVKTLVDGGKHMGNDDYPVSFAILRPQVESANMARLEVEYTERQFSERFNSKFHQMMKDYNQTDINNFISTLKNPNFDLPKKTRDVYFYFPLRLQDIYTVLMPFSYRNLATGADLKYPYYSHSIRYNQTAAGIELYMTTGERMLFNMKTINIYMNNGQTQTFNVNTNYMTKYDANGNLNVQEEVVDPNGRFSVILMADYGRFVIVDQEALQATYVQLFILEKYDETLFEPVVRSPYAKIYRLKK